MKIYLLGSREVVEDLPAGSKRRRKYAGGAFYEVPEERGVEWIASGVAFEATGDNKVKAFNSFGEPVLVDLDEGGNLTGLFAAAPEVLEPEASIDDRNDDAGNDGNAPGEPSAPGDDFLDVPDPDFEE